MFDAILERLARARDCGDVEILTMGEVAARMEQGRESRFPAPLSTHNIREETTVLCPNNIHTHDYLKLIGVAELPPLTSPFDPGYDPATLESHLEQSSHLMAILKVSMACWMVANEDATRRKVASAKKHRVPTVTGGGPFEIAVAQNRFAGVPRPLRRHRLHKDRVRRGVHGHALERARSVEHGPQLGARSAV